MNSVNFDTSRVESYRRLLKSKSENILQDEIPNQLRKVEEILAGRKLKSSYQQAAREYSIDSIAEFKKELEKVAEAQMAKQADMEKALEMLFGKAPSTGDGKVSATVSKKNSKIDLEGNRKRSSTGIILESQKSNVAVELKISDTNKSVRSSKSETSESEEEVEVETPIIEPNEKVLELFSELKPLILRLAENCVTLRNWIVILIPRAEDGNNFGVEVQEQCIVKLIEVEKQMNQILEEHAAYHLERSTILSKLLSCGEISDYSQCIFDADERQCRKLQNIAHNLRSSYNNVYQTITNNFDKITAPRGQATNHLNLY